MEIFNYVMVLSSVIIGLAITHLLQGAARIVQHPGRYNAYWVHLVWAAYILNMQHSGGGTSLDFPADRIGRSASTGSFYFTLSQSTLHARSYSQRT
jgi:hypothetical protein